MEIEVEYLLTSDDMTDEEYADQKERTFIITKDMIHELVSQNADYPYETMDICDDNFYINIKQ